MKLSRGTLLISALLAAISAVQAIPESEAAAGRLLARRFGEAIVAVRGSVTTRMTVGERAMPPNDQKFDINGTVITPTGLTIASFSALDPKAMYEANRGQMNTGGLPVTFGDSVFKNLKIRLGGGREVPVKLVFKDAELDAAFLFPEGPPPAPGQEFTYVNLNDAPEAARILGDYYLLSRAPEIYQRVLLLRPSTIMGIIERPHRRLIVSTDFNPDSIGTPIFDPQGKVLGINLHVVENGLQKGANVVPAADVALVVAQNGPAE